MGTVPSSRYTVIIKGTVPSCRYTVIIKLHEGKAEDVIGNHTGKLPSIRTCDL